VTKTTKATSLDWKLEKGRLAQAAEQAEEILRVAGLTDPPVDPFVIAAREKRRLKLIVDDFKNRFDGQLEYSNEIRRFLCFLNSKYDRNLAPGAHHPRTRFSLAHELAHYYLDPHAGYLIAGGKPHGSRGEFERDAVAEREADAFAAAMLMPSTSFGPDLNAEQPSLRLMSELASKFQTSLTSTLFRAVQLTDFPAAFVGLKNGAVAWCFPSEALFVLLSVSESDLMNAQGDDDKEGDEDD